MKLRTIIVLFLTALGALPLLLTTLLTFPRVTMQLEKLAQEESLAQLHDKHYKVMVKVEGFKGNLINIAALPGTRELVGHVPADSAISWETASKRFRRLMARWFDARPDVLAIMLMDSAGEERIHLKRQKSHGLQPGSHGHSDENGFVHLFSENLVEENHVYVDSIKVDHSSGSQGSPHRYILHLVTPLTGGAGEQVGQVVLELDATGILQQYGDTYLVDTDGRYLHRHRAEGSHDHEAVEEPRTVREEFPGLLDRLNSTEPFILHDGHDQDIAWLPVIFNPGRAATFWLGSQVDQSEIRAWRASFTKKIVVIGLALLLLVFWIAEIVATKAEEKKNELLDGLNRILTEDSRVHFSWQNINEVRQLALELNTLGERYGEMQVARRQDDSRLRESEERLRTILYSVQTGIFIVEPASRTLVFANPEARRLLGLQEDESVDQYSCTQFFCPSDGQGCPVADRGQTIENAERILTRVDGAQRTVLKTVVPFTFEGAPHLLESMVDISEMKRVTTENEQLQAQLNQSQKLEAIGILAGGVAHDFNNLLTIILGFCDLSMQSLAADNPVRHHLRTVKETSKRASDLVRQLLLFSREQPMRLAVIDLNQSVNHLLKMLNRLIGEDITVTTQLASDLWPIEADSSNLDQVVMNLAVNARDAMPGGGTLTIATSNHRVDEEEARAWPEARAGRYVRLEVGDSGLGISDEVMEHLFEPFFTTKEAGKGTGLGLAVVYGIVKKHGGWIEVRSAPGEGTSFVILLPATTAKAGQMEEGGGPADLSGSGQRILLVEDDERVRSFTSSVLKDNGYLVEEAGDGEEAVVMLNRGDVVFDLIFCDVVLPGISGVQVADAARHRQPALPVLLTSGYTDKKLQWPSIQQKNLPFLPKPYSLREMLLTVRQTITQVDEGQEG